MRNLIVIGSGGFAREAYCWIPPEYHVEAFYSNLGPVGDYVFGRPVVRELSKFRGYEFLVAVGSPQQKHRLWDLAKESGLKPCDPIIHHTAVIGSPVTIGAGSIICPQAVVTTNVRLGCGVILNLGATVGHDCVIDDFTTIAPGANISGNVTIGERGSVGTNAAIREKISIAKDCTVGMGAVVVKDLPYGTTWVGNPARQMLPK